MHYVIAILALLALLASILVFTSMAVAGIRNGRVYYEPSCPPIPFRSRPVAFVALCLLYLAVAGALTVGVVRVGSSLLVTP